jgi:hypothetical protein
VILAVGSAYDRQDRSGFAADAVVLVGSRVAAPALDHELTGRVGQVYVIGDALAPGRLPQRSTKASASPA